MSIYAISDLHLSFNEYKPMNIFGEIWCGHEEKIRKNWIENIEDEDLIILPGDFSWSTYLNNTNKDFEYLNNLPGKKLLAKGNHDYWWTTLKSMRNFLKNNNFKNIDFIYNNSYEYGNYIIVGTRGWNIKDLNQEDQKIYNRELERLKISLNDGVNKYGNNKEIIVCMHYPPIKGNYISDFVKIMLQYNVKKCIYGHLHGTAHKDVFEGNLYGIDFKMVSCDYTDFKLIKLI